MLNTRTFVRTAIGFLALWLVAGPAHADLFVNSSANNTVNQYNGATGAFGTSSGFGLAFGFNKVYVGSGSNLVILNSNGSVNTTIAAPSGGLAEAIAIGPDYNVYLAEARTGGGLFGNIVDVFDRNGNLLR